MPEYLIFNETDTLGHLLQEYALQQEDIYFCAYHRIHPLKREIKVCVESLHDHDDLRKIIDISTIQNDIQDCLCELRK